MGKLFKNITQGSIDRTSAKIPSSSNAMIPFAAKEHWIEQFSKFRKKDWLIKFYNCNNTKITKIKKKKKEKQVTRINQYQLIKNYSYTNREKELKKNS